MNILSIGRSFYTLSTRRVMSMTNEFDLGCERVRQRMVGVLLDETSEPRVDQIETFNRIER